MQNDVQFRYYALYAYFRQRFGCRVQKVALDAGFSCPNRDGTISRQGCWFCGPGGSGSGLLAQGMDLRQQWDYWCERFEARYKNCKFMAYLQSYSNTHGPLEKVEATLRTISELPQCAGLSLGTRPDCLEGGRLELLKKYSVGETWLELGLQTVNEATLARINRGHGVDVFARACHDAAAFGLKVCAHVIFGLPGDGYDDAMRTIEFVNGLPVHGIKFHNLFVCKGSVLAREWESGRYEPLDREVYINTLLDGLERLRPDIVVQRLSGDAMEDELLAPEWARDKGALLGRIRDELKRRDMWQGRLCCGQGNRVEAAMPEWFAASGRLPEVQNGRGIGL
ncbi:MAG: TIGR01212 family radical SAM protein [Desulfovibrio sp.]|uniref:TIGR01212 family radical SAM protein n=1 Tax=Desulfovibrio sp. 7SRBS1 TaxID=3378064 RepID=UPI003B40DF1F